MKLKPILAIATVALLTLTGCSSSETPDAAAGATTEASTEPLRIIADPSPHQQILEYIQEEVQSDADGDFFEIVDPSTGVQNNQLIVDNEVDGSYSQHAPYLRQWLSDANLADDAIVSVASVHVEPLGVYYNQNGEVTSITDVTEGTTVAITDDPANQHRALLLLAANDLITLPADFDANTTELRAKDVEIDPAINTRGLDLQEVKYEETGPSVSQGVVDLAVVNGNVALESGLDIDTDTIAIESAVDNPYANLLTVRKELATDPRVLKLAGYLESPEVAAWITETFGTAVLPVNSAS